MEDKENETITLEEFITIIRNAKKFYGNRITYIRMTDEFYNHLMSQLESWHIQHNLEVNNLLGITVIKIPNGKLHEFYRCSKADWDMTPIGARA